MGDNYIFISYARVDYKRIREFVLHIAKRYSIWFDQRKLTAGDRFDSVIEESIRNACCCIFFLTMNYGDSEYCWKELKLAMENKISIYPVVIDSQENIDLSMYGKNMMALIEARSAIAIDRDDLQRIAKRHGVKETDTTGGKLDCYLPPYVPEYREPDYLASKYTFNYMPKKMRLIGREKEMQILKEFIHSDKTWALIVGVGGSGKSRLAYELFLDMHDNGWDAYYFIKGIELELMSFNMELMNDTLIIIDYAIAYSRVISRFLDGFTPHNMNGYKLKVLLVDRDDENKQSDEPPAHHPFAKGFKDSLHPGRFGNLPLFTLKPLDKNSLRKIMKQYTCLAHGIVMDDKTSSNLQKKLSSDIDPRNQRPLYALFMAESWASGNDPVKWEKDKALSHVFDREKHIWLDKASLQREDIPDFVQALTDILTRATFNDDIWLERLQEESKESLDLIEDLLLTEKSQILKDYLEEIGLLASIGNKKYVAALKPDLVGEYLVLSYMQANPFLIHSLFTHDWYNDYNVTQFLRRFFMDFKTELYQIPQFWNTLIDYKIADDDNEGIYDFINLLTTMADSSHKSIGIRLARKAEEWTKKLSDLRDRSICLSDIGETYRSFGQYGKAKAFFERSLKIRKRIFEETSTPQSQRDLYVCYFDLGDICQAMGDLTVALGFFDKAWDLNIAGKSQETQNAVGYIQNRRGEIYMNMGDLANSRNFLEKAMEIREQLVKESQTLEYLRSLSITYEKLGDVHQALGDLDRALAFHEKSLSINTTLSEDQQTIVARRDISITYERVALIHQAKGNLSYARDYFEQALKITKSIMKETNTIEARLDYCISNEFVGDIYRDMDNVPKALKCFLRAKEVNESLMKETQSIEVRTNLGVIYERLGDLYLKIGDLEKSREFTEKECTIREDLRQETNTVEALRYLAIAYEKQGKLHLIDNRFPKAKECFEKSMAIRRQLMHDTQTISSKRELSKTYDDLGDIHRAMGELVKALLFYEKAMFIHKQLVDETHTMEAKRDLCHSYINIGDIHFSDDHFQQAKSFFENALELSLSLASQTQLPADRRDFSIIYSRLGDIFLEMNNLSEALDYYEKVLEIDEFHEKETQSLESRRDLGISYSRIGDIYHAMEDLPKARYYFMKSFAIREKIGQDSPSPEALDDLGLSHYKMALVSQTEEEKIDHLHEVYRLWKKLYETYPYVTRYKNNFSVISEILMNEDIHRR